MMNPSIALFLFYSRLVVPPYKLRCAGHPFSASLDGFEIYCISRFPCQLITRIRGRSVMHKIREQRSTQSEYTRSILKTLFVCFNLRSPERTHAQYNLRWNLPTQQAKSQATPNIKALTRASISSEVRMISFYLAE